MPSSPLLFHSGFGIIAAVAVLAFTASLLALTASVLLLWLYRRRVARLMSAQSGGMEPQTAREPKYESSALRPIQDTDSTRFYSVGLESGNRTSADLYHSALFEPRRHAYRYGFAGILFALIIGTSATFALSHHYINYLRAAEHPFQYLFMCWSCAWPAVLTVNIVADGNRRRQRIRVLGYFILLFALGALVTLTPTESSIQTGGAYLPAWSGESPFHLAYKWSLFNIAPTVLIRMFRHRRVSAAAPLALSFMTVVSTGLLGILTAAFVYQETSVFVIAFAAETFDISVHAALIGYFIAIGATASLLCVPLGWRLLVWIRNGYLSKSISDQSLAIDAIWLIYASFYSVILAIGGPGWVFSAIVAFFIFKIAVKAGNKVFRARLQSLSNNPELLVLRVFSLGKRSENLFEIISKHWRYLGGVRLIAGTDLAMSTVAPHRLLAFIGGKLRQLFITGEESLERSLTELDTQRDADGRFRIVDFFCHADTWQNVLLRLVKSANVVLMDLRSFAPMHAGCIFEIRALLNSVPLERLVFVVDETTDKMFLRQTLEESYSGLRSDSPNRGKSLAALEPLEFHSHGYDEIERLLKKLCTAAQIRRDENR